MPEKLGYELDQLMPISGLPSGGLLYRAMKCVTVALQEPVQESHGYIYLYPDFHTRKA